MAVEDVWLNARHGMARRPKPIATIRGADGITKYHGACPLAVVDSVKLIMESCDYVRSITPKSEAGHSLAEPVRTVLDVNCRLKA